VVLATSCITTHRNTLKVQEPLETAATALTYTRCEHSLRDRRGMVITRLVDLHTSLSAAKECIIIDGILQCNDWMCVGCVIHDLIVMTRPKVQSDHHGS
jgi:hypothetical protein